MEANWCGPVSHVLICHQGAIDLLLLEFCTENFESDVRIGKQKEKFVPRMNPFISKVH